MGWTFNRYPESDVVNKMHVINIRKCKSCIYAIRTHSRNWFVSGILLLLLRPRTHFIGCISLQCNIFNGRRERERELDICANNRTRCCFISTSHNLLKCAYIIANLPFLCIFHIALRTLHMSSKLIHCIMLHVCVCTGSIHI